MREMTVKVIDLDKMICIRFCPYYKPGKNEGLACLGFTIIERLIEQGINIPFENFHHEPDSTTEERLIQTICIVCPFSQNDCDFFTRKKDVRPCGGFKLLGYLIENHSISLKDIRKVT
jgi:hypothetical protein